MQSPHLHHLGATRSSLKADHLLHTPDTFIRTPLPGAANVDFVVHVAPRLGAHFTQMTAEFAPDGTLGPAPAQRFLYVIEGELALSAGAHDYRLAVGGFAFLPQGVPHTVRALTPARAALIEKPYQRLAGDDGQSAQFIVGNESAVPPVALMGDEGLRVRSLMPDGPAYDFAVNTMTYHPGAALGMVEIHVMEHGLLMLEGGGIYRLGDAWYPVEAGDFIWMGPYCPQWFGALGKRPAKYLIYKDWRRHPLSEGDLNITIEPKLDIDLLSKELAALSRITEAEPPVVTRVVFTDADLRARAFVKELCEDAGLAVTADAVGNTFARWVGNDANLAPIATGSHIDAIPNAGSYDGTVGVLGGLEAIRALQRAGFKPRRSIELVIFTAEEPTRFGIGCLGSRMMGSVLTPQAALALRDKQGAGLEELRLRAGFSGPLDSVAVQAGRFHQFVELHIEQGPLLEQEGVDLGLVTAIAAPASLRILIEGEGGHAGGQLMPGRKDALTAAAELILALESAARSTGVIDTVGTVGVCEVFPGAVNSIPSRVRLETDIRDTDKARRDGVLHKLHAACVEVAQRRGVTISTELVNADPPTQCDSDILAAIESAAAQAGRTSKRMVARAYHDSSFVACIAPVAMLFIPCRAGVSHRPDEYASPQWIQAGVDVLARTLGRLAS